MNLLILLKATLLWTREVMIMGRKERGNLRMLNRLRETKAFWASRMLDSSRETYVANVVRETRKGAHVHTNEVPAYVESHVPMCVHE